MEVRMSPPLHITVDCEVEGKISELFLRLTVCLLCSGVVSMLLDQDLTFCPSDQLRVVICADVVMQPNSGQQHLQVSLGMISVNSDFFISFSLF